MSCDPGPVPAAEEVCCASGTRTRTVELAKGGCSYVVGEWGACSVQAACSPGETKACANEDPCGVVPGPDDWCEC